MTAGPHSKYLGQRPPIKKKIGLMKTKDFSAGRTTIWANGHFPVGKFSQTNLTKANDNNIRPTGPHTHFIDHGPTRYHVNFLDFGPLFMGL